MISKKRSTTWPKGWKGQKMPEWENDKIQFARLLSALSHNFVAGQMDALAKAVGLTPVEVTELLDRAEVAWEEIERRH